MCLPARNLFQCFENKQEVFRYSPWMCNQSNMRNQCTCYYASENQSLKIKLTIHQMTSKVTPSDDHHICYRNMRSCFTWESWGLGLKSFESTEYGFKEFNKWHNKTPSLSACAKSKAWASCCVALWSFGRILHWTSQSTHSLHSSAAIFLGRLSV